MTDLGSEPTSTGRLGPAEDWSGSGAGNSWPRSVSVPAALLRTARPKQWPKNILVFAAPAAAGSLDQGRLLGRAVAAFALFCLTSSGVYFINDATDVTADRSHPTKRNRPVAAGAISARTSAVCGSVLVVTAAGLGGLVEWRLAIVLAAYAAVQLAYCLYLKREPILDLAAVASGFVLRAIAGAVALPVPVSQWFLLVACFGSLLMVTGKRLAEQADLGQTGGAYRATLDIYSRGFLRSVIAITAGGAIVGYGIWAFSTQTAIQHHHDPIWFQLSIVPMIIALLRYVFLLDEGQGASPEDVVLTDRPLLVLGLVWAALLGVGIYVH